MTKRTAFIILGGVLLACFLIASRFIGQRVDPPSKMEGVIVNVATLCDSATDDNGKLTLQGAFDTIYTTRFPAIHLRCALAVRLAFGKKEIKKHSIKAVICDSKGNRIIDDIETPLDVKMERPDIRVLSQNLIINVTSLEFPREGLYFVQLWLDGTPLTNLPFHVLTR